VFTQTIPLPGAPCADAGAFADGAEGVGASADGAAGAEAFEAGGFGEEAVGDGALVVAPWPTVTSGVILPMVEEETPAFDRSLTEE